ncbi:MAG: hypothetical protein WC915_04285 [archaeon]|jgi:hypothetical protein
MGFLFQPKKIRDALSSKLLDRLKIHKSNPRKVQARVIKVLRSGRQKMKQDIVRVLDPQMSKVSSAMSKLRLAYQDGKRNDVVVLKKEVTGLISDLLVDLESQKGFFKKQSKLGKEIFEKFSPEIMGSYKETQIERDYHMLWKKYSEMDYRLFSFTKEIESY